MLHTKRYRWRPYNIQISSKPFYSWFRPLIFPKPTFEKKKKKKKKQIKICGYYETSSFWEK